MPKRPDRAQVRLDAFLSPRGGVASTSGKSIPPRGSSMGTSSRVVGHFHQTDNHRASDGSAFVNCPVCDTRVALRLMNEHMDGPACGTAGETRCDEPRQVTEEPVHGGETPAGGRWMRDGRTHPRSRRVGKPRKPMTTSRRR